MPYRDAMILVECIHAESDSREMREKIQTTDNKTTFTDPAGIALMNGQEIPEEWKYAFDNDN